LKLHRLQTEGDEQDWQLEGHLLQLPSAGVKAAGHEEMHAP